MCTPGTKLQKSDEKAAFIATPADLKARIPSQLAITKPDFIVFVPECTDERVNDTGNEHFLVFDGPDGSLMAVWTQSSAESQPDLLDVPLLVPGHADRPGTGRRVRKGFHRDTV